MKGEKRARQEFQANRGKQRQSQGDAIWLPKEKDTCWSPPEPYW